jgi:Leucine-rich repeat (LRR) protein
LKKLPVELGSLDLNRVREGLALLAELDDAALESALAGRAYIDDRARIVSELPVDVTVKLLARGPANQAEALDLSCASLRFLDLRGFDRLRTLDVGRNPELRELGWLPPLLQELVLDQSPVLKLPVLPQLSRLSAVEGHAKYVLPRSLVELDLTRAFVTTFPTGLPKLVRLALEGTMIRVVGNELEAMPGLTRLNLANTPLMRFYEPALVAHPALRELDVRNTPLAASGQLGRLRRVTHPLLKILG